ncbi:hypothetical protein ACE6H2_014279 [Prunus campanulata]
MLLLYSTCIYLEVIQVPTTKLPSGSQVFQVQILNECPSGCRIGQIHLSCGCFHSERLILPQILRPLGNNECLVNNGIPIATGATVSFEYASPNQFPFSVSSLFCSV